MSGQNDLQDFFKENGSKLIVALAILVLIVVGISKYNESSKAQASQEASELGKAMTLVYAGESSQALVELESLMASNKLSGLSLAKAALLAGNIKYQNRDFEGAGKLFDLSVAEAGSATIVLAAAMHGQAAVSMEKKDFQKAITQWEAFIAKFGNRTGNLEARYSKEESVDEVSTVSDAMWLLTLCYKEAGDMAKAKATAEKLQKIYGDKPEVAAKVQKFFATL